MAYQTGTVTNSNDLGRIVRDFLLDIGWELVSTIDSSPSGTTGRDWVFRSYGSDEDKFINIRIASGLSDIVSDGDIQHPMQDKYTGHLNGFAYHYFHTNGTNPNTHGHSEVGRLGPLLYYTNSEDYNLYEFNMWKSSTTSKVYRTIDGKYPMYARMLTDYDGKRFIFKGVSSSGNKVQRIDLYDNSITNVNANTQSSSSQSAYVRLNNGKEYIYTGNGYYIKRYDILDDIYDDVLNTITDDDRIYGSFVSGVKRTNRDVQWVYAFKGYETKIWAMFNAENEVWTEPISELPPFDMGPPGGLVTTPFYPRSIYVVKEQSGYTYDRIYVTEGGGDNGFASVGIDDDGYVVPGSWVQHNNLPTDHYEGCGFFLIDGVLYWKVGNTSTDLKKHIYKWEFGNSPNYGGSWELVKDNWFIGESEDDNTVLKVHDRLATKVVVSEFKTNKYWLFGDLDRLVVVVKDANGHYSYMYLGLFRPYANSTTSYLTADCVAGASSITVANPCLFDIGKQYMISSISGEKVAKSSNWNNTSKIFGVSQVITVLAKNGNTLSITPTEYDFYAGDKIGEDPMPIMVSIYSRDHAQVIDNWSLVNDTHFEDPPWQTYRMTPAVDSVFAETIGSDNRANETYLFPILLVQGGNDYIGKEVRGELIGVYASGTSVASEEEIASGADTYIAFEIHNSGIPQRIVVGPMA
jgi:hypothetical protein